ncbi:Serine/threonine-protein phosphatase 2A activator 2 [Glugoides intestinalis]
MEASLTESSENLNKHVDFKSTLAYSIIKDFIFKIDNSIKSEKQLPSPEDCIIPAIWKIVDETPLSSHKGRYANPAMALVIEKLEKVTENPHLRNSFGNRIRMDFGTGHELNFLCYLYSLFRENRISLNQVAAVLNDYFRLVRFYIHKFNIEAAGSKGCWSIDDYLFLPYLFGSSEMFHQILPVDLVETGIFNEACKNNNSPMLKSICKLSWPSINHGMFRMYEQNVLGMHVVTQHFIYTDILPSKAI